MNLRIHQFLPFSRANGPGARAVVWVQGCSLGCPKCFNPLTHAFDRGDDISIEDLFHRIAALRDSVEGVTLSGGEPLEQRAPVTELLRWLRAETTLSVVLFTGFGWNEIESLEILRYVDVLIAARYNHLQRLARGLRGSANKTIHFLTDRYTPADLEAVPAAEVILTPHGEIMTSGIDPL